MAYLDFLSSPRWFLLLLSFFPTATSMYRKRGNNLKEVRSQEEADTREEKVIAFNSIGRL